MSFSIPESNLARHEMTPNIKDREGADISRGGRPNESSASEIEPRINLLTSSYNLNFIVLDIKS